MKQIELIHCADRTIKLVVLNGKERVLLWFTDNTFVVLQAVRENDYDEESIYIEDTRKFDPTDFSQIELIKIGFMSQEEVDKAKEERDKVWRAKQRKEGLLKYRLLAEHFGSLDQYKPEDFAETETEHELKRRMAKINES